MKIFQKIAKFISGLFPSRRKKRVKVRKFRKNRDHYLRREPSSSLRRKSYSELMDLHRDDFEKLSELLEQQRELENSTRSINTVAYEDDATYTSANTETNDNTSTSLD